MAASVQDVARRLPDLPALTGLRFLAAFSVAVAHGASISFRMDRPSETFSGVKFWMEIGAGFGMTLFFVLSGFVIHYNYREALLSRGKSGFLQFLWARFSRLYPLFIVFCIADLVLGGQFYNSMLANPLTGLNTVLTALPYYLTFTQSWFYTVIGPHSLTYAIGTAIPVTWSISTEWFFYLCYPLVLISVVRLVKPWQVVGMAILWSAVWGGFAHGMSGYTSELDAWAAARFGPVASLQTGGGQDSFVRWLLYFSPYLRIGEFVLGCLTAQLFMVGDGRPIGRAERALAPVLLTIAVFSIPFILYLMYVPGGTVYWVRRLSNNFGLAPSIALLLFCVARYRPAVLRCVASRPAVRLGDASYSIYLTHLLIFSLVMSAAPLMAPSRFGSSVFLFLRLALMLAFVLLVSVALYSYLEDPARRMLRQLWNQHSRFVQPATVALVPLLAAVAVLVAGDAVGRAQARLIAGSTGIMVDRASYGENCGAPAGNVTASLRTNCDGRVDCQYVVDVSVLGDPAPGCGKAFSVEYICRPDRATQRIHLAGEAGLRSVVRLRCPGS